MSLEAHLEFCEKLNCWEVMKCGRQLGGSLAFELGVCPASTEVRLDGIHGGINAGRACWVLRGTICSGFFQGTFSQKYKVCSMCRFYQYVKREEGKNLIPTVALLRLLHSLEI